MSYFLKQIILIVFIYAASGLASSDLSIFPYASSLDYELKGNSVYGQYSYTNLLNLVDTSGVKKSAYGHRQLYIGTFKLKKYQIRIGYLQTGINSFINNLDALQDHFRFKYSDRQILASVSGKFSSSFGYEIGASYNNYLGYQIGLRIHDFVIKTNGKSYSSRLKYNISAESGSVPFAVYDFTTEISYKLFKLYYSKLVPIHPKSTFQTNIQGNLLAASFTYPFSKFLLIDSRIEYASFKGALEYNHSKYGYLDQFRYFHYKFKLGWNSNKNHQFSLGNQAYYTGLGTGSYLEIWPFNYWSQLFASKTKLTKMDTDLNLPFVEYVNHFNYNKKKFNFFNKLCFNYAHLLIDNHVETKERYFITYPVLFNYETISYNYNPDWDGIFTLTNSAEFGYKQAILVFDFMQLVPVRFDASSKSDPKKSKNKKSTGGFFISVSLKYRFK